MYIGVMILLAAVALYERKVILKKQESPSTVLISVIVWILIALLLLAIWG